MMIPPQLQRNSTIKNLTIQAPAELFGAIFNPPLILPNLQSLAALDGKRDTEAKSLLARTFLINRAGSPLDRLVLSENLVGDCGDWFEGQAKEFLVLSPDGQY